MSFLHSGGQGKLRMASSSTAPGQSRVLHCTSPTSLGPTPTMSKIPSDARARGRRQHGDRGHCRKAAGQGAWQSATQLRGYELLGKYLGIFKDQVDVSADEKLIEQLHRGRLRAAGLLPKEEEESSDAVDESKRDDEPKPN